MPEKTDDLDSQVKLALVHAVSRYEGIRQGRESVRFGPEHYLPAMDWVRSAERDEWLFGFAAWLLKLGADDMGPFRGED